MPYNAPPSPGIPAPRHTFTVWGTDVDVELPAGTARRIDLSGIPAGTYEVICAVPGHDKMRATLTITG